jgi:prevent-host-death family protein
MQVNLHDAKTHLSRYVDQALEGEEVVIARAGRPLVKLVPLDPHQTQRSLGFLQGQAVIDADLKADFAAEIGAMFEG